MNKYGVMIILVLLSHGVCYAEESISIGVELQLPKHDIYLMEPLPTDVVININQNVTLCGFWENWEYGDSRVDVEFRREGEANWKRLNPGYFKSTMGAEPEKNYEKGDHIILRDIAFAYDGNPCFSDPGVYELIATYAPRTPKEAPLSSIKSPIVKLKVSVPEGRSASAFALWKKGFEDRGRYILGLAGINMDDPGAPHSLNADLRTVASKGAMEFNECATEYYDTIYGKYVLMLRDRGIAGFLPSPDRVVALKKIIDSAADFPLCDEVEWRLSGLGEIGDASDIKEWTEQFILKYPQSPLLFNARQRLHIKP